MLQSLVSVIKPYLASLEELISDKVEDSMLGDFISIRLTECDIEQMSIEIEDRYLMIKYRCPLDTPKPEKYFDMLLKLSDNVDVNRITAEFKNDILKITLPKIEKRSNLRISIS